VRESTMMRETVNWAAKLTHDVQIGGFGSERQCRGRQRCLPIKPGSPKAGASKEMSDRFKSFSALDSPSRISALAFSGQMCTGLRVSVIDSILSKFSA